MEEEERDIDGREEELQWYYRPWVIFLAFFAGGPLALILVWSRPRTNVVFKTLVTVIVVALTFLMTRGAVDYYRVMAEHIEEIAKAVNP